jgi:hypothetical protein
MPIIVSETTAKTSVAKLIAQALKDIGALGVGETPTADEQSDSFDLLKQMLGLWQIDGLMIYASSEIVFAATGAQTYTIGPGGDVDTTRPTEIVSAFWRDGGIDYPVEVLTSKEDYDRICMKTLGSIPEAIYFDPTYPLGSLYVYPQPSTGELHLNVRAPLPEYASVTEDLNVPKEYELAIRYSLCELLAPAFERPLRPDLAALAKRARKLIKRNNVRIPELSACVVPSRLASFLSGK